MDDNVRFAIAGDLHNAWKHGSYLKHITETYSYLTIEDAYAIQMAGIEIRKQEGECVIGAKIGLTSKAMMDLFKV